jgi:hypothetical protein
LGDDGLLILAEGIENSAEETNSYHIEGSQLPQTPGPLYEELLRSTPKHQDQVELKENMATCEIIYQQYQIDYKCGIEVYTRN